MNDKVSDELLNAFLDGQLDVAEKERVFQRVSDDSELAWRACEQRKLKELVRHAYADVPPPPRRHRLRGMGAVPVQALAALLLLACGIASGWFAHDWSARTQFGAPAGQYAEFAPMPVGAGQQDQRKIILHVGSGNRERMKSALDETESLLAGYAHDHKTLRLEMVANSDGLDMLRADVSPYARRIARLRQQYPNLSLVACRQSIERLKERGVKVQLLPGVVEAPSALDQVVLRMKQGWVYIKA